MGEKGMKGAIGEQGPDGVPGDLVSTSMPGEMILIVINTTCLVTPSIL